MTELAIPVELPKLSKFGPAAIDRVINRKLAEEIPGAKSVVFNVKLTSGGEERLVSGYLALSDGKKWGGAFGGILDTKDRRNWEIELQIQRSL